MIRYYCDSNIYRFIKPSSMNYNKHLHDTMNELKDKVVFCFSRAHIEDLRNSMRDYHLQDIECMSKYVNDNYFAYHRIEKKFNFYLATPKEVYETFDFSSIDYSDREGEEPISLHGLLTNIGVPKEQLPLVDFLESYLDIPIRYFMPSGVNAYNDKWIGEKFPDGDDTTLGDFMQNMMSMVWDEHEFEKYRKFVSEYYNRDDYSYDKWNMEFNERFRNTPIQRTFLEYVDMSLNESQKDDFYWRFNQAYTILEAMNVTVETTGKKKKKKPNSFSSLSVDAQHAYYAAHADFLISDDAGLRTKALILYSLFNIPTKVLSVKDFISRKGFIISQEENSTSFFKTFKFDLEKSFMIDNSYSFDFNRPFSTFKTTHCYFNYFNRLQTIQDYGYHVCSLYVDRILPDLNNVMFRELGIIIDKLLRAFGPDDNFKGAYNIEEKLGGEDILRKWTIDDLSLNLVTSKKSSGTYIVLVVKIKI